MARVLWTNCSTNVGTYYCRCQEISRLTARVTAVEAEFELSQRGNQKALATHNLHRQPSTIRLAYLEIYQRRATFPYRAHHRIPLAAYRALAEKASTRW